MLALLLATAPAAAALRLAAPTRSVRCIHMSIALELERAPPSPPPSMGDGGDRGDGDGEAEFLRLMSPSEMSAALQDWKARARIYKMSDNAHVSERQAVCVDVIEQMQAHCNSQPQGRKRLAIGLFDAKRLWALSVADVSAANGLVVQWLTVRPQELNDDSSTASLRLVHGLHVLAEAIDLPLDLKPLKSKGMLKMSGLLAMDSDNSWERPT